MWGGRWVVRGWVWEVSLAQADLAHSGGGRARETKLGKATDGDREKEGQRHVERGRQ